MSEDMILKEGKNDLTDLYDQEYEKWLDSLGCLLDNRHINTLQFDQAINILLHPLMHQGLLVAYPAMFVSKDDEKNCFLHLTWESNENYFEVEINQEGKFSWKWNHKSSDVHCSSGEEVWLDSLGEDIFNFYLQSFPWKEPA